MDAMTSLRELVGRLRGVTSYGTSDDLCGMAADAIERLQAEIGDRDAWIETLKILHRQEIERLQFAEIGRLPEIGRLRAQSEADAKIIGEYEYVLGNIAHDTIPNSLDPDEYALVALRARLEQKK
jgi:hypothetical protein